MTRALLLAIGAMVGSPPTLHGRIVFEAQRTIRPGALVVMDADGTHRTRVAGASSGEVVIAGRGAYAYNRLDDNGEHAVVVDAGGTHAFGNGRPLAFSPDGKTLVILEADGTSELRAVPSGLLQHAFPATMGFVGWSPGGLLFAEPSGDLVVARPDGSGERTVARSVGPAAWSPDGVWIAYEDQPGEVRLVHPDGSDDHALGAGGTGGVVWSPYGTAVAFASPTGELVVARPDGTSTRTGATVAQLGTWSPDGTAFAFLAGGRRSGLEVFSLVTLTVRDVSPRSGNASWSPDGRTLLVRSGGAGYSVPTTTTAKPKLLFRNAGSAAWLDDGRLVVQLGEISTEQLASIAPSGGVVRYLPGTRGGREPAPSPDGTKVAFVSASGAVSVARADGTHRHVVARSEASEPSPSWSPNGRFIAYATADAIEVIPSAGGRPRRVTGAELPWTVAWSPDGKEIAFGNTPGDSDFADIVLVRPDGTHRRVVVHGEAGLNWGGVAWSPDGRTLAVGRRSDAGGDPDGVPDLYLLDLPTRRRRDLGLELSDPSFSRDGRRLAVANDDGHVDVVDLRNGRVRSLAAGSHPSWSR